MSVADLSSSSGVVTIDLNANPSGFYRLATTESVTSWTIAGFVDGDGFLLAIDLTNAAHTVQFTGLVDTWTNGVPSLTVGETIYFPVVRDGTEWVGESSNVATADLANVLFTATHSVAGSLALDADDGHHQQITLTANVTAHTISNLNQGETLTVTYIASAANRDVDFTGATEFPTFTNPGSVTITSGSVIQATFYAINSTTYLMAVTEAAAPPDPSIVEQTIAHSANGTLTVDADSSHTAEVTMTANVTGHTINNLAASDILSVHYLASGAARTLDFTGFTTAAELTNPGSINMLQNEVYRAVFIRLFTTTYLVAVEQVA